jgi:hypothetical protein
MVKTTPKRTPKLFENQSDSLSPSSKRKQLRQLQEEETRERKSILAYGIPHSEFEEDYELSEIQRAWPIFWEISTQNMGEKGCDVRTTDIKSGYRLWKLFASIKPIKIEFHTQKKCDQAMRAFRESGMYGKRTLSEHGIYKHTGIKKTDQKTKKTMPTTYIQPSSTRAEREAIRTQYAYYNSELGRDEKVLHRFQRSTRLKFSNYHAIEGEIRPRHESDKRNRQRTIDNPEYKPLLKRFSSYKEPQKITVAEETQEKPRRNISTFRHNRSPNATGENGPEVLGSLRRGGTKKKKGQRKQPGGKRG